MKSNFIDYFLSTILIALISLISFGLIFFIYKYTSYYLGHYHFIIDGFLFLLFFSILSGLLIRLIMMSGKLPTASYSMEDPRFQIWKLVGILHEFALCALKPFDILFMRPIYAKLFCARIGKNVVMGGKLIDPWFIEIQDEVILGLNSSIIAHEMTSGFLKLKQVKLCSRVTVGVNAVIMPGVVIGENSIITPGAIVKSNTMIPPNQIWGGVPAKFIKNIEA